MGEKMKIIEWNVHGMEKSRCPSYVADEIEKQNADIAILTEYVVNANKNGSFEKQLSKLKYKMFTNNSTKNGILIAVKGDWEIEELEQIEKSSLNFLGLRIKKEDSAFLIIGVRVTQEDKGKDRFLQIRNIIDYIGSLDEKDKQRIIVAGDFNNYRFLENENDYIGEAKDYNIQKIREAFEKEGFLVEKSTPIGNVYYVFSYLYGSYPYKYDHIFVKGFSIDKVEYDWDYKCRNYQRDVGRNPDHAILRAEVF